MRKSILSFLLITLMIISVCPLGNVSALSFPTTAATMSVIDYIPGDVNGDSAVNGKDITLLRRYNAGGYGVSIDEAAADVNDDGVINGKDITLLRQYNAGGYGVELKPSTPRCTHNLEYIVTKDALAPTCTKKGYTAESYCSNCGNYIQNSVIVPKLGHAYGEWYTVEESTEKEHGTRRRNCLRCNAFETEKLPLKGHTYQFNKTVPATCSEYGYDLYVCVDCQDSYHDNFTAKIPHVETKTIIDPTCNTEGYTTHTCINCGYSYVTDITDAKGHNYVVSEIIESSCQSEGSRTVVCSNCGDTNTEVFPKADHAFVYIGAIEKEDEIYSRYQCAVCSCTYDAILSDNNTSVQDGNQIFDQDSNFTFYVVSPNGKDYILENLILYDASINIDEHPEAKLNCILTADHAHENTYAVTANVTVYDEKLSPTVLDGFEPGATYVAEIFGDVSFLNYPGTKIQFTIASEERCSVELKSGVEFLRVLEDNSPGYYPYNIVSNEDSDYIFVTINKIDSLDVNDIVIIGEVRSLEEMQQYNGLIAENGSAPFCIGKIINILENDDEEYILILGEPNLSEVYDEFDIYSELDVVLSKDEKTRSAVKNEVLAQFYDSKNFAEFLCAVDETTQEYALKSGLKSSPLRETKFSDIVTISISDPIINGNKVSFTLTGNIGGENGIEFKNNGKRFGSLTIEFTINATFEFSVTADYRLKYWWWIPTGVDYFDICLTQKDTFSFDFNVDLKLDYNLDDIVQYWYNTESGIIHSLECTHINKHADLSQDNWEKINENMMKALCQNNSARECTKCRPYSRLQDNSFVLNKNTGKLHCLNCLYAEKMTNEEALNLELDVNELLSSENIIIYSQCSFHSAYNQALEYCNQEGITLSMCSWCKPNIDMYSKNLVDKLTYSDWGEEIENIQNWIKGSGVEPYKSEGAQIAHFGYVIYGISLNIDLRFVFSFDFKASLNIKYEQTKTIKTGMRVSGGSFRTYSSSSTDNKESYVKLTGSLEVKAGIRLELYVSIAGLEKWVRAGFYGEAGAYLRANGVVYLSLTESSGNNFAGAKFELGVYVDIGAFYKFLWWSNDFKIFQKEFPILTLGYDRVYYMYNNTAEKLEISGNTNIDPSKVLNVKYYDIASQVAKEDVLSLESSLYTVSFKLLSGTNCSIIGNNIIINSDAPQAFSDTLIVNVSGSTGWNQYRKNSSSFFLGEYEIPIEYKAESGIIPEGRCDHDLYITVVTDATCTNHGYITHICDICNNSYITDYTDAIGHNYKSTVTPPTCVDQGYTTYECSRCGHTYVDDYTPATGHTYVDGICVYCGESEGVLDRGTCGDSLKWTFDDTGTLIISGTGAMYDFSESWYGYNQAPWGSEYENIKTVIIENGATNIGKSAFANCYNITLISIPNSVTSIGNYAFSGCAIASIVIPSGVRTIGSGAFSGCYSLANVEIAEGVENIGDYSFEGCSSLTSIVLPESLLSIGWGALEGTQITTLRIPDKVTYLPSLFYQCTLSEITIGSEVTRIEEGALSSGPAMGMGGNMAYINVSPDNANYASVDGVLFSKDMKTLVQYPIANSRSSYDIPNGVTTISSASFMYANNLVNITIPNTVITIGEWAFEDCRSLTSVTIPDSVNTIGYYAFGNCVALRDFTIGDGVKHLSEVFSGCAFENMTIGKSVEKIEDGSFHYGNSVSVANFIVSHDNQYYASVNGVLFSKDMKTLIQFPTTNTMTEYTIPYGVETINGYSFQYAGNLIKLTIPDSVTTIGEYAFSQCNNLTNVTLSKNLSSIEKGSFANCIALSSLIIPDGVISIGDYAFNDCTDLKSVLIPYTVASIGGSAFYKCTNLISITIPSSVKKIYGTAFNSCSSLKNIIFDGSAPTFSNQTSNSNGVFYGVKATAYYPTNDDTWTSSVRQGYGGNITWVAYDLEPVPGPVTIRTISLDSVPTKAVYAIGDELDTTGLVLTAKYSDLSTNIITSGYTISGFDSKIAGVKTVTITYDKRTVTFTVTVIPDEFDYSVTDGKAILTKYNGNGGDVVIPSVLGGFTVAGIGNNAFYNCSKLTSVTIPLGVTSIGNSAFASCRNLTDVFIPETVTSIGDSAFSGCNITNLIIPNKVTTIGNDAFAECYNLSYVEIPESVTIVGDYAFSNCSITSIVIPSSVRTIGSGAFSGCYSLANVEISEGVEVICDHAFSGCAIASIVIPSSVRTIGSGAFSGCYSLANVEIAEGIENIGDYSFEGCSSLTSIVLPASLLSIGWGALEGTQITTLRIPDKVTYLPSLYYQCTLSEITIGSGVTRIEEGALNSMMGMCSGIVCINVSPDNANYASVDGVLFSKDMKTLIQYPTANLRTSYDIPNGVTTISASAFMCANNLVNVTIPNTVITIGEWAFEECRSLTSVTIPDSVKTIGYYAFGYCESLKNLIIGNGVTHIPQIFSGCSLVNLTIGSEVEDVSFIYGDGVSIAHFIVSPDNKHYASVYGVLFTKDIKTLVQFPTTNTMTEYAIPYCVKTIEGSSFQYADNLVKVTVPDSVTTIGEYAFNQCNNLTNVTLSKNLTGIEKGLFANCSALSSVAIPGNITRISDSAFSNCENLEYVMIPNSVTYIGNNAFSNCKKIEGFTLPYGLTIIGGSAFYNCNSLTSITIPASVTEIYGYAFANCTSLTSVKFEGNAPTFYNSVYSPKSNFSGVTATAYYPIYNDTWTSSVRQSCGGNLRWATYHLAHEHNYVAVVTDPTCTNQGYTTYICDICNDSYITDYTDAIGHNYKSTVTPPTCIEQGYTTYKCTRCSNTYVDNYTPATGHTYANGICVNCGESEGVLDRGACGDNLKWTFDDTGALIISGTGAMYDFSESWYGYNQAPWGSEYENIKTVIIENGATSIGNYAFTNCYNIASISVPDSVTSIGERAFSNCQILTSIVIPAGVVRIGDGAFEGTGIIEITLPSGIDSIGNHLFGYCENLKSITLLGNINRIGWGAFSNCRSLEIFAIPNGISSIESNTFENCLSLKSINIPNSVTSIYMDAFMGCLALKSISIPSSTTYIEWSAFRYCSGLESIAVDSSNPIYYSSGNCLIEKESGTLMLGCNNSDIPEDNSITSIGDSAFYNCGKLTKIDIPESVTSIGYSAFEGCSGLTEINIPKNVTYIGGSAFSGCDNIKSINIPEGVTKIESYTFSGCDNLKSVTLPNSLKKVEWLAFRGSSKFTDVYYVGIEEEWNSVSIDNSYGYNSELMRAAVHYIPECDHAFSEWEIINPATCTKNGTQGKTCSICGKTITKSIPAGHKYDTSKVVEPTCDMYGYTKHICSVCGNINEDDYVERLGHTYENGICTRCGQPAKCGENLTWILDSSGNLTISGTGEMSDYIMYEMDAWYNQRSSIKTVTVESGVTSIGSDAFSGCDYLTKVTIANTVTSIHMGAFFGCYNLKEIEIPSCVTYISPYTFCYCPSLKSVTIPRGVTFIGECAFDSCSALIDVYYEGSESEWNNINIEYGNDYLTNATIYYNIDLSHEHNFTAVVTEPTCTQKGYITYTCDCGKVYKDNYTAALGHAFDHGVCRRCGEITPVINSGDCGDNLTWELYESGDLIISGTGAMYNYEQGWNYSPWYSGWDGFVKTVLIENGATSIGNFAFLECVGLTSVMIPNSVTSIGDGAFMLCQSLESLSIPECVISIGTDAFHGTSLKAVVIGSAVTSIGDRVFANCPYLESIMVDRDNKVYHSSGNCLIETASKTLIAGCKNSVIPLDGSITSIKGFAFLHCTGLTDITIPDGLTSIGSYAFCGCTGLTSVTILNSIISIADYAFFDCFALQDINYVGTEELWSNIYINDGNSELYNATMHYNYQPIIFIISEGSCGDNASWYLYNEGTFMIIGTGDMWDWNNDVFSEWCYNNRSWNDLTSQIKNIIIYEGITSIGDWAFYNCDLLEHVIPASTIISIGENAFGECPLLENVFV